MERKLQLSSGLRKISSGKSIMSIMIGENIVDSLYNITLQHHQRRAGPLGFAPGTAPQEYIERNYRNSVISQLQNFIFSFFVNSFLAEELLKLKLVIIGEPKLIDIELEPHRPAIFRFEIYPIPLTITNTWKQISNFRAPSRKNYRDLDHQVEAFLQEEHRRTLEKASDHVSPQDWISFTIAPVNTEHQPFWNDYHELLWLKIGTEETDQDAQRLFLKKKINDVFVTQDRLIQDYCNASGDVPYSFSVHIKHHTPHNIFCFDSFRRQFKIKSTKEMHHKLIEVFSFRHDISQRRETVEAALKLIVKQYPFPVPHELVKMEEERITHTIYQNPDYYVYKAQENFDDRLQALAHKQLKEAALMDAIAYAEHITVQEQDIVGYLNLMKRPRTKEFIYFKLPETRINECESPLPHELIYRNCLREKVLNHIIFTLTHR